MSIARYVRVPGMQWRSFDDGHYEPAGSTGYPDATNTGPIGDLTVHVGNINATPDQIIENLEIRGFVLAEDGPLTLRNCRIVTNEFWPCRLLLGGIVEDVEIIGGDNTQACLHGFDMTVSRVNLHGGGDGIRMGRSTLADSYIHDPGGNPAESHNDMVEILGESGGGNRVVHNTIKNNRGQTSCVMMSEWGVQPNADTIISNNYIAGAGYSVYGATETDTVAGIQVVDNVFSTEFFPESGQFGPVAFWPGVPNVWSANTWFDGPNAGDPITP